MLKTYNITGTAWTGGTAVFPNPAGGPANQPAQIPMWEWDDGTIFNYNTFAKGMLRSEVGG